MSGVIGSTPNGRIQRAAVKLCGLESWRRRVPITVWLPTYKLEYLLRDAIAGITVGLTSIPQGIAYAIVAGVPPQVGLYSSIFPGIVYAIFGSCKDVTVGPTAILAALLAKYVAKSVDFAYLAAFLSGCIILLLGVLQLGFLLDFISKPVISGFTTAAALQIAAAQLKSLFRISGSSGDTFIDAIANFFKHIKTIQLWDTVLGISCIIALLLLKKSALKTSASSSRCRRRLSCLLLYTVRARNALVVFAAAILAAVLHAYHITPFALTGKIEGGLPKFGPPPFSTVVNGTHLTFPGMLATLGAEGLVMPLVAVLESIAIAKAFAGSKPVDATQEMIAIGACNLVSSFCQSMPATGSFTRTALNHASGVVSPAGSLFKASVVLLAVTLLARWFYFIPRATLAAVIMVAMISIIELKIVKLLWKNSKIELLVYLITVVVGAAAGLEYGILAGAAADAARALAAAARPQLHTHVFKVGNLDCLSITLVGTLSYGSAQYLGSQVRSRVSPRTSILVLDARQLHSMDIGVAENLITVLEDLEEKQHWFLLWNFPDRLRRLVEDLRPTLAARFVSGPSIDQHILGLDIDRREYNNTFNQIFN
ncbi:sodium-independent sulfate anion transporter-like isoform X2 [Pectinophora gossypiella]|uniref:sodium-independent sulfate anion transporter-like isoform X2 n=1 Tax=Pectinophora gossypiella TaxID=13191 RepID=UPI00214E48E4|nr:sodium-independent sulfate anion transporter-like isoform X2 [Pectinophora gossypiella]